METLIDKDNTQTLGMMETLAQKRASALAYLCRRAHEEAAVYSKTSVRILTPEFVQSMAQTNTAQRCRRHPWLERAPDTLEDGLRTDTAPRGKLLSLIAARRATSAQLTN